MCWNTGRIVPIWVGGRGIRDEEENAVDIRLRRYNIQNGWNGVLKSALRAIEQANMYLGVLFETNITGGV